MSCFSLTIEGQLVGGEFWVGHGGAGGVGGRFYQQLVTEVL